MRLKETKHITGQIVVETGLHIGAGQETMEISGNDNPIIRNPATGLPYIPGSSIRGKMRSLIEWHLGEVPRDGNVLKTDPKSKTAKVFGVSASKDSSRGPTRLIIRDAHLTKGSRDNFLAGTPITEMKSENSINRITAMANPRPIERVLPGVSFDFELLYRIFDIDDDGKEDDELFDEVVLQALSLLEVDSLGGGSSRGNGKINLNLQLHGQPLELPSTLNVS